MFVFARIAENEINVRFAIVAFVKMITAVNVHAAALNRKIDIFGITGGKDLMRAYKVSKECDSTFREKAELIKSYDVGDLLYVLREIEKAPRNFDEIIIQGVIGRLYDMGIKCI